MAGKMTFKLVTQEALGQTGVMAATQAALAPVFHPGPVGQLLVEPEVLSLSQVLLL
jgi:hypothetical protein